MSQAWLATPYSQVIERIPANELRQCLTVTASGETELLNPFHRGNAARLEVCEVVVQCQASQSFQLWCGESPLTPVFEFVAGQSYIDAGFVILWPQRLSIVCGNSSAVAVGIRYRNTHES